MPRSLNIASWKPEHCEKTASFVYVLKYTLFVLAWELNNINNVKHIHDNKMKSCTCGTLPVYEQIDLFGSLVGTQWFL